MQTSYLCVIISEADDNIPLLKKGNAMNIRTAAAMLSVPLLLSLTGCSAAGGLSADTPFSSDFFAMDTFMSVKAYGKGAENAVTETEQYIRQLEDELSVTDVNSDISRINSGNGSVNVQSETADLIGQALGFCRQTGGALDITLYPVLRAWGFTTGEYRIPVRSELDELLEKVGYSQVVIDGDTVSIPDDVMIDLGAVAKGYASDCAARIMRENGVTSAIINLGGNVQTVGAKPDGSMWKVAVHDPYSPDTDMCVLEVSDKAVITSGSYERFFTGDDGKNYWHILDPADGCPADNGIVSATIIGGSGIMCDAYSTAMFVAGTERAVSLWKESSSDYDMILVTDKHEMLCTEGISGSFTNTSDMNVKVISRD